MNRVLQIMFAVLMASSFSVGAMQEQQPVSVPNQQQGHGAPHKCSGSPKCKARCLKCVEEGCWDGCGKNCCTSKSCDDCGERCSHSACAKCCDLVGTSFCKNLCCCCADEEGCCWVDEPFDYQGHDGHTHFGTTRTCCCRTTCCCATTWVFTVVGIVVGVPLIVVAALGGFRGK